MEILGFSESQLFAAMLLMARLSALFVFAPIYSQNLLPGRIKAAIVIAMGFCLMSTGVVGAIAVPKNLVQVILMMTREFGIGAAIGLVIEFVFTAVTFGGHIVGVEMGHSMASNMDPMVEANLSAEGRLYFYFAGLLFFAVGGDRMMIEAFAGNLATLPLGQMHFNGSIIKILLTLLGEVFVTGYKFAAPVVVGLFCATLVLGILARSVPQMNMMQVGFAFKIVIGLVMMGLMLPKWADTFVHALSRTFEGVHGIIFVMAR